MAAPPLLRVSMVLPSKLQSIQPVLQLVNAFLLPTTLDAAIANNLQLVTKIYGDSRPWSIDAMNAAATSGRLNLFEWLNCSRKGSAMIVQIAANGHLNVLEHLGEHYKGDFPIKALEEAAAKGHTNVIKYLEPRIGGLFNVLDALFAAALNGHAEATEFLLAKCVLWRDLTGLAKMVVAQGHVKVVQLLIRSGRTKIHPLLPAAA